jgi:ABC-2 type transport system ATP-binding protein
MNAELQKNYQVIKSYLDAGDLNRTGIYLLDTMRDYDFPRETRERALELRIKYNQEKDSGNIKINSEALSAEYSNFYSLISMMEARANTTEKRLIVSARNISKIYYSRLKNFKLEPIDMDLHHGEIIGIVGENGNGKTTLLRMIAGDLALNTGEVTYYFKGQEENDWPENKQQIAFVPQRLHKWYGRAIDNLSFVAATKGIRSRENIEKVEFIIHRMGLTNYREHTWNQLSSGYRLRFAIARALVWSPDILILDEPLANLDINSQELMLDDLRNIADSIHDPTGIILSSQQLHEVEKISDRVIFLKNGRSVFNGKIQDIAKDNSTNIVEISGNFDLPLLSGIFSDWQGIRIEPSVSSFQISFPDKYSKHDLLKRMTENKLDIEYYRDITRSTKKLFNDKY